MRSPAHCVNMLLPIARRKGGAEGDRNISDSLSSLMNQDFAAQFRVRLGDKDCGIQSRKRGEPC